MRRSVEDLIRSGIQLDVAEAVAIVSATTTTLARRIRPVGFVPNVSDLMLHANGRLDVIAWRPASDDGVVADLARLLMSLLPARDQAATKPPSGLVYTMARALRTVQAPPIDTLEEFSQCLARIESRPARHVLRDLAARAGIRDRIHTGPVAAAAAAALLVLHPAPRTLVPPARIEMRPVAVNVPHAPIVEASRVSAPGRSATPAPRTRRAARARRVEPADRVAIPRRRPEPRPAVAAYVMRDPVPPAPVPTAPATSSVRPPTRVPSGRSQPRAENLLTRMGRKFAGDGTYRPQPFPRPD
jgi:hypothetical protein